MSEIQIVPESDFGQKRIGILCLPGLETFIKPIASWFCNSYSVKTCYSNSMPELESVINWSDLILIEFCNELAIELTNKVKALENKKVIIRLHSYEALQNYTKQVRWEIVDSLIFVADHIKRIVLQQIPNLEKLVDVYVVPNGI